MALFAGAQLLTGCMIWTSRQAGDELRQENRSQTQRIVQLEQGLEAERTRLETQITELEQVLQQATQVVTRNSADVGAQVEQLRDQVSRLEGWVAELQHALDAVKRELGSQLLELEDRVEQLRRGNEQATLNPDEIPEDPQDHFAMAEKAFQEAQYGKARALLKAFIDRHGNHVQAARAQFLLGACYLAEQRPATALGEYRKILSLYPQSPVVNEALLDMALAFYELHACTDAKSALQALLQRKPGGELESRAKAKLKEVEKAPTGYCTS